jgi:hypothetical protein
MVLYTVIFVCAITNGLNRAEPFLRGRQLRSHSKFVQGFIEPENSLPCSQEPSLILSWARSVQSMPPNLYVIHVNVILAPTSVFLMVSFLAFTAIIVCVCSPPLCVLLLLLKQGCYDELFLYIGCRSRGTAKDTGLWDGNRPLAGPKLNWKETAAWFISE